MVKDPCHGLPDLPAEIVDAILQQFARRLPLSHPLDGNTLPDHIFSENHTVVFDKRHLAQCSLVCRYWAQRCRPYLFQEISVESRADLDVLLVHLRTNGPATPAIRECISFLTVHINSGLRFPWSHPVFFTVTSCNPPPHVNVVVSDYRHTLLPRCIPSSCTGIVSSLELKGVKFHRAVDFLRLVASFRSSWCVECDAVDFGDPIARVHPWPMWMPSEVQLLFTNCRQTTAVLDALQSSISHWIYQQTHRVDLRDAFHVVMDILLFGDEENSGFDYQHSASSTIRVNARLLKAAVALTVQDDGAVDITVTFRSGWAPENAVVLNWAILEDALLRVAKLSLRFHVEGDHLFKWFLEVVPSENLMPRLSSQETLSICYTPMDVTVEELVHKSKKTSYSVSAHLVALSPAQTFALMEGKHRNRNSSDSAKFKTAFWTRILDERRHSGKQNGETENRLRGARRIVKLVGDIEGLHDENS